MSDSKSKNDTLAKVKKSMRISEKQRTLILILLIIFAVGFIFYIQNGIDDNFVETL